MDENAGDNNARSRSNRSREIATEWAPRCVRTIDRADLAGLGLTRPTPKCIHFAKLSTYHLAFSTMLDKL